ncbi:MAG TPA: aminotransferase class V-fold PLP-dependent enzyme [Coriobacteriia bacterium]|jgi:cysteine desulfurase family protein
MTELCPIYLDHAATSWPKPQPVLDAVVSALTECGGNPGRGVHALGLAASRLIFEARGDVAAFLGVPDARDLAFLSGCTEGTNIMLKGLLKPGDRVAVSSMEHNAVARPLHVLAMNGLEVDVIEADETGFIDPDRAEAVVRAKPTRAVICLHASNVTGTIQPIGDLADIAHAAGALMLVDGAQGGGHLPVDVASLAVDAYAVSGHKGLLGPQGVGGLYLAPSLQPEELLQGGTGGGSSELPTQPEMRPDRYEAGTPNTPGIAGLGAAVRFLAEDGRAERQRAEEAALVGRLAEGLAELPGIRVLGPAPHAPRVPVVSVVHDRVPADRIAFTLDKRYGIAVRAGLHCAPWAHRALGTLGTGAVRFSVGFGDTADDIEAAIDAMRAIVKEGA